jgi:hypothetical protein
MEKRERAAAALADLFSAFSQLLNSFHDLPFL